MKKIIAVILVFVLLIGVLVLSVNYRNKKTDEQHQSLQDLSTQTTSDEEQKENGNEEPVIVTDDGEYEIFFDGDIVTIVKGEYKVEMETWQYAFKSELPVAVSKNMDSDDEKELLIKVKTGVSNNEDGTQTALYAVYLFDPYIDENGEKTFNNAIANANTWIAPFSQTVRAEVTQLESCKKILQYAMESVENQIEYDKNGLGTGNYVGYARALSDDEGNYYTYKDWSLGQGIYYLDDEGNITLDIQVLVEYEEIEQSQIIGFIHCNIQFEEGAFSIVPKKINFRAQDKYRVTDPRESTDSKWEVTVDNQGPNPDFQNKNIDWIDWEYDVSGAGTSQSLNFETYSSKIKCVETVEFTQSSITLTAKEGYSFSSSAEGNFAVILNSGEDEETDIAYTCSVKTVDDRSTVVITLDRNYSKDELSDMTLKLGA